MEKGIFWVLRGSKGELCVGVCVGLLELSNCWFVCWRGCVGVCVGLLDSLREDICSLSCEISLFKEIISSFILLNASFSGSI